MYDHRAWIILSSDLPKVWNFCFQRNVSKLAPNFRFKWYYRWLFSNYWSTKQKFSKRKKTRLKKIFNGISTFSRNRAVHYVRVFQSRSLWFISISLNSNGRRHVRRSFYRAHISARPWPSLYLSKTKYAVSEMHSNVHQHTVARPRH